jgi:ABC-type phosphate/phosphonate transport system substrate-binding protein
LIIGFVIVFGLIGIVAPSAYGHGGKTNGGETFTAFQVLEKSSKLYDRLIVSGKLTEDWKTGLKRVMIDIRNSDHKREYLVQFEKSKGEPSSVYFFFDQEGEYSGSNFTGN